LGRREGANLYIALPTPKGPRRAAVIAIRLSGSMLEHLRQALKRWSQL
jgi:hypothetical protein